MVFEHIHQPDKGLEPRKAQFFGGFVSENEPSGGPQFDLFWVAKCKKPGSFRPLIDRACLGGYDARVVTLRVLVARKCVSEKRLRGV